MTGFSLEVRPDAADPSFDFIILRVVATGVPAAAFTGDRAPAAILRFHLGSAAAVCAALGRQDLSEALASMRDSVVVPRAA